MILINIYVDCFEFFCIPDHDSTQNLRATKKKKKIRGMWYEQGEKR